MGRRRRTKWWHTLARFVLVLAVLYGMRRTDFLARVMDRIAAGSDKSRKDSDDYARKDWPHWSDADSDCQDARQEALIAESKVPVEFEAGRPCRVARGRWHCPYTDRIITDPRELDVDHLVPLHEAHRAGGYAWSRAKRRRYANTLRDADHLIAVEARANRQKGDKGPEDWLPTNPAYRCEYLRAWKRVKAKWGLAIDPAERRALSAGLKACADGRVPPRP